MANSKNEYLLGSGHLFLMALESDTEIPATLFNTSNNMGHISGGAKFTYSADLHEVKNDDGDLLGIHIIDEDVVLTTGMLTWDLEKLSKATFGTKYESSSKTLTIGGMNSIEKYAVGFEYNDGKRKVQFSMIGMPKKGIDISLDAKNETVVDVEFVSAGKRGEGLAKLVETDAE